MSSPSAPNPQPPPTTTPPSAPTTSTSDTSHEQHLLSSLAHLQTLHAQLRHLRSTIPRLLSPLLTPEVHVSPEEFYRAWRLSAIGAGEEVERFRGEWEGVRDMKGGRWVVGEKGVVGADEGAAKREKVMDGEGVGKGKEKETEGEGDEGQGEGDGGVGIEEVADVVGRWSQGREGVEVEVDREGKGREIMVYLPPPARIHFHITTLSTPTPEHHAAFDVTCKEAAQVHKAILRSVAARSRPYDLVYLLDLLDSYKDVKERLCQKCGKLLDSRAMFPVVRKRKRTRNDAGELETTWEALHESCS